MQNSINFYKNGKFIYELSKVGNLYILTNEETKTSKAFNDIPTELENLLPEGINRELFAIKHNISVHNKFELLKYLDDVFGRVSTNNEIKKEVEFDLDIKSYKDAIRYIENFNIEGILLESFEFSMTPKGERFILCVNPKMIK